MDEKYRNLLEILEKEVTLYMEFLDLLQRERQNMVDLHLEGVHECNNLKETLILDLKVLEEARADVIASLHNNFRQNSPALSVLIDNAPPGYRKSLESCRSNLLSLVNSIREITQINGALAERAENYTRSSLSFLGRLVHESPVYLPSGQIGPPNKTGKLVCKKG